MKYLSRHHIRHLWLTIPFVAITLCAGIVAQVLR